MSEEIRWPVGRCFVYMMGGMMEKIRRYGNPVLLLREKFDELKYRGKFKDGPYVDDFGSGWNEPYVPCNIEQAFGIAMVGRKNFLVYCELNPKINKSIKEKMEEIFGSGKIKRNDFHGLTKLLVGENE